MQGNLEQSSASASTYNHVIGNLQDYMLHSNHFSLEYLLSEKKINTPTVTTIVKPKKCEYDIFFPKEKDSLFWCFFIIENDKLQYDIYKNKTFCAEKKYKINFITKLSEHKNLLKQFKLKVVDIEDELGNNNHITIKGLEALCRINNVNIMFIWDNKYYEIETGSDEPMCIIFEKKTPLGPEYGVLQNNDVETIIAKYRLSHWKVDNPQKILKSMGSYKLAELQDISSRLKIDITINGKKKTKKLLYDEILHKL